jgi:hypothetical protein
MNASAPSWLDNDLVDVGLIKGFWRLGNVVVDFAARRISIVRTFDANMPRLESSYYWLRLSFGLNFPALAAASSRAILTAAGDNLK